MVSKGRAVDLDVPWPTRAPIGGDKAGHQWLIAPLTRALAMSVDAGQPAR
jgi:hypothetical protein